MFRVVEGELYEFIFLVGTSYAVKNIGDKDLVILSFNNIGPLPYT